MDTSEKKQQQKKTARARADVIMKVRAGIITATEGAAILGVSRKTYNKWENRALGAMLEGLEDRETGRPEHPGPQSGEAELQKKLEELRRENNLMEQRLELSNMVHKFELERAREQSRKKRSTAKKKKKRTSRS